MSSPVAIDSRQFRNALGAFTTGVTIVTTRDAEGHDIGLTANSFNSVSLDPPLVLWSLAKTSLSMAAFQQAEFFAVHILAADQQSLSDRFAKRGVDKFAGLELARGPGGIPLLNGCTARFQCKTAFQYEGGDHEIFVGQVIEFDHTDKKPLVFQGGGYGMLFKEEKKAAPAADADAAEGSFNKDYLGVLLGSALHQLDARVTPLRNQHGFDYRDYLVLTILAAEDRRPYADVDALMKFGNQMLDEALIARLRDSDLIAVAGSGATATLSLTPAGHAAAIELLAASKAAEADLLSPLEYGETQMLKQLLHRVVRAGHINLPSLWRKSH
jgi:3-hydroxy-9,10-secoandrosta-1,3,5(10)-triene-9,17-dione monooxygenase reductase component